MSRKNSIFYGKQIDSIVLVGEKNYKNPLKSEGGQVCVVHVFNPDRGWKISVFMWPVWPIWLIQGRQRNIEIIP